MKLRIGLDIDDTVCDFINTYLEKFGTPKNDFEITKNVTQFLIKDKDFWLNLPVIHRPNFNPTLYCTKRVHPKEWSKQYLKVNLLPDAPIYQIYCQLIGKSTRIKGRVDVFVDDSISNFIELNLHGVPCLLLNKSYNQGWGPVGRIYNLEESEIEESYYLFRETMFPYFNELVNGYRRQINQ